jgi:hypothetical protein
MRTQTKPRPILRPELKHWDCLDHDPIETWVPNDPEVLFWLTLAIGLPGSEAADNFEVCVVTLAALRSDAGRAVKPRGAGSLLPIVLQSYSWPGVIAAVGARLEQCEGRDWLEVQEKLRRHFFWEYEGM